MGRLLNSNSSQNRRLNAAQTAVMMLCLTLISKFFGFIRELILASAFGTSYVVDAFDMAKSIPDALLSGVLGAIGTTYTPLYSNLVETRGQETGKRFTDQILTFLFLITLLTLGLGLLFSGQLVGLFAPNFQSESASLTARYLRIAFSYTIFTAAISIYESYLRYHDRFLQPIVAGYLYNVGAIVVILICARTSHLYLAYGALAGYFLQFLMITAAARRTGYHYRPNLSLSESIRQILKLAIPVFIGSSISPINTLIDKMLASGLPEGSVSSLNYGLLLINLITSLTVSIIITMLYPKITRAANQGEWSFYNETTQKGFSLIFIISLPFSMGAFVFADQVVQVIYERGAFNTASTALTADAFRFYSVGLAFMSLDALLSRVFTSLREVKIPVICSAVSIAFNIALNLMLIGPMQHRGLALATSIASGVNFILLMWFLKRQHPQIRALPHLRKLLKILLASALAVGAALWAYQGLVLVWMPRIMYLGLSVTVAAAMYLLLLKALQVDEIGILKELLHR